MFEALALGELLKSKSSCYCEIDAYLMKLKYTLSPESNSTIEENYRVIMNVNRFHIIDRNLQLKALDILEKSFQKNKSPIIGSLLYIPLEIMVNSRANDILLKALNVC